MTTAVELPSQETVQMAYETLTLAEEYVEQGWTQRDYAVTADGDPTSPTSPYACKWCLDGACMKAREETGASREAMNLVRKALTLACSAQRGNKQYPFWFANAFNDDPATTQLQARAVLLRAAAVLPVAHLVQGCYYPAGWTRQILAQLKKGDHV